jgi:branched-chain amino acid transport system substrate-binding protein
MKRLLARWTWIALATALALVVAACGDDDDGDGGGSKAEGGGEPIVIGLATAQSGFLQPFDAPGVVAAELARADINAKGGVLGRKLEFVDADTKSDLDQVANAAIKVINDGAEFLVVTCDFDFGAPAAAVAESKKMVSFSLCAGSPKFGVEGVGPHAYTMGTGTPTEGAVGAQWALKKGWENAFIILDSQLDYSTQYVDYFKRHYAEGGGTIVGEDTFSSKDTSVASQIGRIRSASPKPDVIVLASLMPGAATVVRQIRAAGIDTPILSNAGADGAYWLDAVPNLSNFYNDAYSSIHGDDPNEQINELVKRHEERTGEPLATGSFATGYSVIEALAAAIEKAGSTDSEEVKKALDSFTNQELVVGPTTYTPELHMPNGRPMRIIEIQNGKAAFLELFEPENVEF